MNAPCDIQCVLVISGQLNLRRLLIITYYKLSYIKLDGHIDKNHIFEGIIHAGAEEALKGSQLKLNNLARSRGEQKAKAESPTLNFGRLGAERWCKSSEQLFLKKLIKESQVYSTHCRWFTSLVSKAENEGIGLDIHLSHSRGWPVHFQQQRFLNFLLR